MEGNSGHGGNVPGQVMTRAAALSVFTNLQGGKELVAMAVHRGMGHGGAAGCNPGNEGQRWPKRRSSNALSRY